MKGLMQDWPLRVTSIIDHACRLHGEQEIVTRSLEGPIVRATYSDLHLRARKVAQALKRLGLGRSDIVATLAWNTGRHLEIWYGIMGIGAVCHTLNPRLFADQLVYIINHAEDKYIFVDAPFVPLLEAIKTKLPNVRGYVVMTDSAHMPPSALPNTICYEEIVAAEDGDFDWVKGDETDAAGLCYTSGTTGNPKGVLYSHRSNVLHSLITTTADGFGLCSEDSIVAVVPMFHANAWGLAFSAPMVGAKLIMPGGKMDGESIYELLDQEKATFTAGVPTVWLMLLQYLQKTGKTLPHLTRLAIGGSAAPRSMIEAFERDYDVKVSHSWGMTEMSPVGTVGSLKSAMHKLPLEKQIDIKMKQGRPLYGIEMKITDDDGNTLPRDGKAYGHLMVRGPAVVQSYYKSKGGDAVDSDGWFDTGDVATLDEDGYMQITDRSKDVIKSGGEWISSIELENITVGHPKVAEAAAIGIAHPKWDERPLLVIVTRENETVSREEILKYLEGKIARWWMPDDVVFVKEIPHTATGKIQKTALREQFRDFVWDSGDR